MRGAFAVGLDAKRPQARRRATLVRTALGLIAASTLAAGPVSAGESLREALASAYRFNPKLDAERARLRASDEEVARAHTGYHPTITGAADIGRNSVSITQPANYPQGMTTPRGYQISVKQPIFNGFQTDRAVQQAEAQVRAGRENLRLVESQTLLDAITAYADVVRDQSIVRIRENNVTVLSKELEAAETRRSVREVTRTDVAQARARRARAGSAADLAKSNLKISRANFERIIGHAPNGLTEPSMHIKSLPHAIEEAVQLAEQESPALASSLYREQASRLEIDRLWGGLLPEVHLEASYGQRTNPSVLIGQENDATISGRVTVPLYDGGGIEAQVRQAKHIHVSRLQEIEQARTELQANVRVAWSKLMAARGQLKSDEVQVESNGVALEGVREEQNVGQRTLLDVLNAEQELLDAELAVVSDRHDLVIASYGLLSQIGRLTADKMALDNPLYDPTENYFAERQKWFGLAITHADGRFEMLDVHDAEHPADPVE